jgi:hypothetical protein
MSNGKRRKEREEDFLGKGRGGPKRRVLRR